MAQTYQITRAAASALRQIYRRGKQLVRSTKCALVCARVFAGIAQLVEQLICNQQVVGSNPTAGSIEFSIVDFRLPIC
jgi:hypothetical protein